MIVGLLNWYDESPTWLAAMIASYAPVLDHVVAVDGAYYLFPHAKHNPRSGPEQAEAITEACYASDLGCTVFSPSEPFYGNEVEKRSFLFQLGEQIASEDDWYLVIDADELVRQIPEDWLERVDACDLDCVEFALWERTDVVVDAQMHRAAQAFVWQPEHTTIIRKMFRALRGLRVVGNHYTYVAGDRVLWTESAANRHEPAMRCEDFVIEHRNRFRPQARRKASADYYSNRGKTKIEREPCFGCGKAEFWPIVPTFVKWRRREDTGQLEADPVLACPDCAERIEAEAVEQIKALGADPSSLARAAG